MATKKKETRAKKMFLKVYSTEDIETLQDIVDTNDCYLYKSLADAVEGVDSDDEYIIEVTINSVKKNETSVVNTLTEIKLK